jgi:hypothetical protein
MTLLIVIGLICGVWMLLRINYVYWSERRAMTPEERKKFDDDMRDDLQAW